MIFSDSNSDLHNFYTHRISILRNLVYLIKLRRQDYLSCWIVLSAMIKSAVFLLQENIFRNSPGTL